MCTGIWRLTDKQWRLVLRVSDVSRAMLPVRLVQLVLLHGVASLDAQVEGDLALDLRVARSPSGKGRWLRVNWEVGSQAAQELVFKMSQQRQNVTLGPQLECVYQYPEKTQVDALLSNMMNELTKVFVRANEYMKGLETRRDENVLKQASPVNFAIDVLKRSDTAEPHQQEKKEPVKEKLRNKISRFRVVHEKQKPFFERLYSKMTKEYRNLYNATFERVDRAAHDPCTRQPELKQMWLDLLQHSQDTLRSAAHRCVQEYLAVTPAENKAQVRKRLKQFLKAELGKVRANQLNMLCDTYQLCYDDLLE